MPQVWEVIVKNQAGVKQATLTGQRDGFTGFSFTQRVNSPGAYLLYFMKRATQTDADFLTRVGEIGGWFELDGQVEFWRRWPCLLYTSPSPRDRQRSRMPSSA